MVALILILNILENLILVNKIKIKQKLVKNGIFRL